MSESTVGNSRTPSQTYAVAFPLRAGFSWFDGLTCASRASIEPAGCPPEEEEEISSKTRPRLSGGTCRSHAPRGGNPKGRGRDRVQNASKLEGNGVNLRVQAWT